MKDNEDLSVEGNSATLCCGGKRCPVIHVDGDRVSIRDDDGNEIVITTEQAKLIPEAIRRLTR